MSSPAKIGFITLGCASATVDMEQILSQLYAEGYQLFEQSRDVDLVIVNTCGYIETAVDESRDAIADALAENDKVIVIGCLGAQQQSIKIHFPQLLAITGPDTRSEIIEIIHQQLPLPEESKESELASTGVKLTPAHYAYLPITEGCNHHCSFCRIPQLRGKLVSRPIGEILEEAQDLVDNGVKELILVAQDCGAYGVDINHRTQFFGGRPLKSNIQTLANALSELGVWVRFSACYANAPINPLLQLMAEGKILPYLEISFQHVAPSLLKQMQHPARIENPLEQIKAWRAICPDLVICGSFITGFPGETEQDFSTLMTFIENAQLDKISCQPYSMMEGTHAAKLPHQLDETIKIERTEYLLDLQTEITANKLAEKVGSLMSVLVDAIEEDGTIIARSYADAAEGESVVLIASSQGIEVGDFVEIEITDAGEYELWGKRV